MTSVPIRFLAIDASRSASAAKRLAPQRDAEIRIVGDLQRPAARAFREAALGQRLNSPGNLPKQELLMVRPRRLAEDLDVSPAKLADGHASQLFDLL
jgi:hypothetical protein